MSGTSIAAALKTAIGKLSKAGVENPVFEARLLLRHCAQLVLSDIITDPGRILDDESLDRFTALMERRAKREPVSHLVGQREFWSLPFVVTPDVLDPRPVSETLVEVALDHIKPSTGNITVMDLGTGSGCLLIAVLSELSQARGVGVDISEAALMIAQRNAQINSVDDRTAFLTSSWGCDVTDSFDLILSNPPYIAETEHGDLEPEVSVYEPATALFAGEDGLSAYREIAPEIFRLLNDEGAAVIECGHRQMWAVIEIFAQAGLRHVEFRKDLEGIERCGVFRR